MKLNSHIIKSALLGSSNRDLDFNIFPKEIQDILKKDENQEQIFLDALSLNYAYFDAGIKLDTVKGISQNIPKAPIETLPYCSENMEVLLALISEENNYAFLTFFDALIKEVNKAEMILPSKYFSKLNNLNSETINAFGERGFWLQRLSAKYNTQEKETDYLSLKKAERNNTFVRLLKDNKKEAKKFLEEVFDAETPVGRLSYLKAIIENIDDESEALVDFIENYLKENPSTSKSYKNLEKYLIKAKIAMPNSKIFERYYEDVLSKIWIKEKSIFKKNFVIKDRPELEELFNGLEFFDNNIDETLHFIFSITPVDLWVKQLSLDYVAFFKLLEKMKTTYDNKDLIRAVAKEAIKSKNTKLMYAYFDLTDSWTNDFRFLDIFTDEELFEFVEHYMEGWFSRGINIIEMFKSEKRLHKPWSKSFTGKLLQALFKYDKLYSRELSRAIWIVAPYLDMSGMDWIEKELKKSKLPKNLEHLSEEFPQIVKLKHAYNKIIK